jgi:hypothetical protein
LIAKIIYTNNSLKIGNYLFHQIIIKIKINSKILKIKTKIAKIIKKHKINFNIRISLIIMGMIAKDKIN